MRAVLTITGLTLCAASAFSCCAPSDAAAPPVAAERWRAVKTEIRTKFPAVTHLSTGELRAAVDGRDDLLLVDVRLQAEFAVSHLPGARHAPGGAGLNDVPKDRPIVVYCSVGYRSAMAAQRLQAEGFQDVRNYLGSIFEWANRDLPLVDAKGPTTKVHPYDASWGELLRPKNRHQ